MAKNQPSKSHIGRKRQGVEIVQQAAAQFPWANNNLLNANSDLDAVNSWLGEYSAKQTTFTTYKNQITKFLLWLQHEVRKPLRELHKEDLLAYIEWFKNPPEKWRDGKGSTSMYIFKSKQSYNSLKYNITILNTMLTYLVDADYLQKNPLKLIKQFSKFKDIDDRKLEVKARILEDEEFAAVLDVLDELSESTENDRIIKARTKLIFAMLYHLGLRVSELSNAMWDNFKIVQGRCWYFLVGKGDKPAQIPVNDELLQIVKKYRSYFNLPIEVENFDSSWVLPGKNKDKPLSSRRIREIVKDIFIKASDKFIDEKIQEKLRNQSPHDLRHLLASDLDKQGLSIIDTKEILRHSSEKTTEIYRNSKEQVRHDSIQRNKVGLADIYSKDFQKHTKVVLDMSTVSGDHQSFGFFLNSLLKNYLKKYSLIYEVDVGMIIGDFKRRSKSLGNLEINIAIKEILKDNEVIILKRSIMRAAEIRGLKLEEVSIDVHLATIISTAHFTTD